MLDLAGLGLARIERLAGRALRVGAMCTYAQLDHAPSPLLAMMAAEDHRGSRDREPGDDRGLARRRAPAVRAPAAAIAARAVALLASARGERRVAVHELAPRRDEILVALELPPAAPGNGYRKLKLGASSWPIATAAAAVGPDGAIVVLGGVSATPLRIEARHAEELSVTVAHPFEDALAPAAYRAAIAGRSLAARSRTPCADEAHDRARRPRTQRQVDRGCASSRRCASASAHWRRRSAAAPATAAPARSSRMGCW